MPNLLRITRFDQIVSRKMPWLVFLGLALLFWATRYWHSHRFLLYEDDWMIVPQAMAWTTSETLAFIGEYLTQLRGHARPLSDSFIYLFSNLAGGQGSVWGIYLAGYTIQMLNIALFYALLRRIASRNAFGGEAFSLMGALGYILFAADTTQTYLTHSLGLHPSITMLLVALHLYLAGYRWAAYLPAACILFSYETPFLVFLAAPLLENPWDRRWLRNGLRHASIMLALIVSVFALRSIVGEGRVGGLGWKELLTTPLLHTLHGPWVSLGAYLLRPVQALGSGQPEAYVAALTLFPIFLVALLRLRSSLCWDWSMIRDAWRDRGWVNLPLEMRSVLRLTLAALVMIALAYPLTFTVRAYAISGRDTRVHAAAVVGAGFLWACLGQVFASQHRTAWRRTATVAWAAICALLVGYGFVIQADYVRAGQLQRSFWSELLPLIADLDVTEGMVVLIEPSGLEDTTQIGANTWALPRLLQRIYAFPPDWNNPPRVYRLLPEWQEAIAAGDGYLRVNGATAIVAWTESFVVPSSHVIWINTTGGKLVRQREPLRLGEMQFLLADTSSGELGNYRHGVGYDFLVKETDIP